ncbi:sugar ABC transporter permease [Streptomyces sp. NPDC059443]|uniref:sugar ABC transporter permease n=1 Tax=unclassified Streptomyces TaxID=2593676 RepID=UPI0036CD8C52
MTLPTSPTSPTPPTPQASPSWAVRALADVLDRVAATAAEAGERFPLYADPDTGRWTTTGRGSWAGGFWAGLLWLRARHTGARSDRAAAAACTARLAGWVDVDTSTRGLILWYATALADEDTGARELRTRAAAACLAALDPEPGGLGLVPWGSAFGGPRMRARVDGVPGMVPLLAAASPSAAASHLRRHLELCMGEGGAGGFVPERVFEAGAGWRASAEPSGGWSRGRAWLLLAVADAAHRPAVAGLLPERPEASAQRLAGLWTGPGAALVPPADTARPEGPLDTSAAAVMAVALLKLARMPGPRAAEYEERAVAMLERLTTRHLVRGRLLDGCYDAEQGVAVRHELVWGDFFLALGLAALTGLADVRAV